MASLCRKAAAIAPSFCRIVTKTTANSFKYGTSSTNQRGFQSMVRTFSSAKPLPQKQTITLHFVLEGGEKHTIKNAKVGDNLLDVIIDNEVDIDGFGACEGTLACSTCHLIFKPEHFKQLPEQPTDEELDMLDLAFGLTDESRLGCQVIASKDMDGWEIKVPTGIADARG